LEQNHSINSNKKLNRVAICVFDADIAARDDIEREKLTNFLVKYIGNENVIICDSLPSIEYWFLIHYTETQKRFTSKELISALRKFIVGFDKKEKFLKNEKWVKNLCKDDKLSLAIERSKKPVPKNYSYSNVYRAFLNIKK
jgi:predicted GIY-YIG superfamily endonuclease